MFPGRSSGGRGHDWLGNDRGLGNETAMKTVYERSASSAVTQSAVCVFRGGPVRKSPIYWQFLRTRVEAEECSSDC